jgi:hypothetical protein
MRYVKMFAVLLVPLFLLSLAGCGSGSSGSSSPFTNGTGTGAGTPTTPTGPGTASETNIIKFLTTKNPTDPAGTLNTITTVLSGTAPGESREILQLVPFQILDNNGVPRPNVPVSISVYSEIGNCPVFIDSPESVAKTVTTDTTGLGIFNAGVTVTVPLTAQPLEVGNTGCTVIYKAVAPDPRSSTGGTIFSYGGFIASIDYTISP